MANGGRATKRLKWSGAIVAAVVAGAAALSNAGGVASADDPWSVPSAQRPITVGTGYRLAEAGAQTRQSPLVSASGRWIVFSTTARFTGQSTGTRTDRVVYRRDRWTDATTAVTGVGDSVATALSLDGNLVAGTTSSADPALNGPWVARFVDGVVGPKTRIPVANATIIGINNDGYFVANTATQRLAGRLSPDSTVSPLHPTAAKDPIEALTPSLRYALTRAGRVDMTSGTTLPFPAALSTLVASADRVYEQAFAISRNGRYVAASWWALRFAGAAGPLQAQSVVRLWDTTTGTVRDVAVSGPTDVGGEVPTAFSVIAVLDDQRVVYASGPRSEGDAGWTDSGYATWFVATPGANPAVASATYAGGTVAARTGYDIGPRGASTVATDISRIVMCTPAPLSGFPAGGAEQCYLRALPGN